MAPEIRLNIPNATAAAFAELKQFLELDSDKEAAVQSIIAGLSLYAAVENGDVPPGDYGTFEVTEDKSILFKDDDVDI